MFMDKKMEPNRQNVFVWTPVNLPFLIQIMANYSVIWEIFIFIVILFNVFFITYGCFFIHFDEYVWNIVYDTEILFSVDVMLKLGVEIWRCRSQNDVLVFPLPYRFHNCLLDLISLLPLYSSVAYQTISISSDIDALASVDWYRLIAVIRLYRCFNFFDILKIRRICSEEALFKLSFAFIYLSFIQCVSCIFIWLTFVRPIDFLLWRNLDRIDSSWARYFRKKKPGFGTTPIDLFILTTHFSTATVTTVGYGDVHGQTEEEMIVCTLIMLIGAIFLNGYFISQLTNFQLEVDTARYDLFFRLEGILRHVNELGMSDFFQAKVKQYYTCLWTYREGVDRVMYFEKLPISLQEDVKYDVCLEMFHKSYLFRDLDEAFLRAVSKIGRVQIFTPDMVLCRYGGYANQLIYIVQGECQAMSKHDSSKIAAILRAGTIIGETNLFFSCPYTISVETVTCCQFISIDKEELMPIFNKFPDELNILRTRTQEKVSNIDRVFELCGVEPVCWMTRRSMDPDPENPMVLRWGHGFNFKLREDVLSDTENYIIVEMQCRNKKYAKNHVTPYQTCVVPEILNSQIPFIAFWNMMILVFSSIYSFVGPYCFSFGASSQFQHYICKLTEIFQHLNAIVYMVDVVVEVIGATPVKGLYYQIRDGLKVKVAHPSFYFDILAAIPFEWIFSNSATHDIVHVFNVMLKSMKLWKVIRYLRYLDNVYPKSLFWFRLGQTFVMLMYGTHFIACILFFLACPTNEIQSGETTTEESFSCHGSSWIASYQNDAIFNGEPVPKEVEPNYLASKMPYLVSFYFSTATLTSVGFGDFSPQNILEMVCTTVIQLIGFALIGQYTALLTSALTCVVKPKLEFQQKLLAVRRFMQHYVIPGSLQRKIVEHYELQFQFHNGIILPPGVQHYLFDAPDYIKNDVLFNDAVLLLDGIPLFSKTESKFIIKLSEGIKKYLIPPNATFVHIGDVRRSVYVIKHGSIGIFDSKNPNPKALLEATGHFGLRDLMFGEPYHHNHVTQSYCVIYEITEELFEEVYADDDELHQYLGDLREKSAKEVEEMCNKYSRLRRTEKKDQALEIPSWIKFESNSVNPSDEVRYQEYHDYFDEFKYGKLLRKYLMHRVIHPAGLFARLWTCWMSLVSSAVITLMAIETFMSYRAPPLRALSFFLDAFLCMDLYVKMHWAYYLDDGLLVTHPLKTAAMYVFEGSFVFDFVALSYPEIFVMFLSGHTNFLGYGRGSTWYTKLRWTKLLQIKRISPIFGIIHEIFVWRNATLLVLYISMTLLVCTLVAAISFAIGCPLGPNDWSVGDEYELPYCIPGTWTHTKDDILHHFVDRWVVGVYYVSQVILVVGFGDMITLGVHEVYLLIIMSILGFIFMRCVVADITAAEIDSDEVRSMYIDHMKNLNAVMTREGVNKRVIKNVQNHLEHRWRHSKGLQPHDLFTDIHPALETDLYEAFVGDILLKVQVLEGLPTSVIRNFCKFLYKMYFPAGEIISRFGNLEYYMYIIVSGKVWVTDRNLSYACTLHKHETFGEAAVMSCIPGRFTFIAAENVEMFAIGHANFEIMLNRFHVLKDKLDESTGSGHFDFFEHKIYEMLDWLERTVSDTDKKKRLDILRLRTKIIKHMVYSREDPDIGSNDKLEQTIEDAQRLRKLFSKGLDDEELPFIYFVYNYGKHCNFPPLIHPNCGLMKIFLSLITWVCMLSPAITVYEVCFPTDPKISSDKFSTIIPIVSETMLGLMFAYMVTKFFTPYKDDEGHYVKSARCIVVNYICSLTGIWLDLFAALPGIFCPEAWKEEYPSRYLRLTRTIWLHRFYTQQFASKNDLSVSAFWFKIKLSVSSFCLMAHILAGVFYMISRCKFIKNDQGNEHYHCGDGDSEHTWTEDFLQDNGYTKDIAKTSSVIQPWRWWVRSLYWVVTVVSTTGFGDITPVNVAEMLMGTIAVFCGAFILSIILSNFTAGMASLTKSRRAYLYQVKLLLKYLQNIGLSLLKQECVQSLFETVWAKLGGVMLHQSAKILPPQIRNDVLYTLFEPVLREVKFFGTQESRILRQVASKVEHSVYLPGMYIVKEGDKGDKLFIVYKGRVSGLTEETEDEKRQRLAQEELEGGNKKRRRKRRGWQDKRVQHLRDVYLVGDTFGRLPALFHDEWYQKSYRAEEYTEVLGVSQDDLTALATINEELFNILCRYISGKYEPVVGRSKCIFSKEDVAPAFAPSNVNVDGKEYGMQLK